MSLLINLEYNHWIQKNIRVILVVVSFFLSLVILPFTNSFIIVSYLYSASIGWLPVIWLNKDYNYPLNMVLAGFFIVILLLITVFLFMSLSGKWKLISLYPFLQSICFVVELVYIKSEPFLVSCLAGLMSFISICTTIVLVIFLILKLSKVPLKEKKAKFYQHPLAVFVFYMTIIVILPIVLSFIGISKDIFYKALDTLKVNPNFNYIQSATRGFIFAGCFIIIAILIQILYKKKYHFCALFSLNTALLFALESIFLIFLPLNLSNATLLNNFPLIFLSINGIGLIWLMVQFYEYNYLNLKEHLFRFKKPLNRKEK